MAKLQVNMENVDFYEIDIDNPPFDEGNFTADEMEVRNAHNDKFIEEELQKKLLPLCAPCACRMQEVIARTQRRASLLQAKGPVAPTLEQEDVDAYKFGVIVTMSDGMYQEISCIIKECVQCHHIDIWGNSTVITRLMAETFTHYEDSKAVTTEDLLDQGYEFANLEEPMEETETTQQ